MALENGCENILPFEELCAAQGLGVNPETLNRLNVNSVVLIFILRCASLVLGGCSYWTVYAI